MKKSGLAILMMLVALVLASGTRAEAQSFLGEFCWQMTGTEDEAGPIIPPKTALLRMGVTHLGGSYYLFQGIAASADGPVILGGTGVVSGSQVFMSLSLSQDHTPVSRWRDGSTMQVTLNSSSLNGTWWDVGSSFNPMTRTFGPMYGAGTWTYTSCP